MFLFPSSKKTRSLLSSPLTVLSAKKRGKKLSAAKNPNDNNNEDDDGIEFPPPARSLRDLASAGAAASADKGFANNKKQSKEKGGPKPPPSRTPKSAVKKKSDAEEKDDVKAIDAEPPVEAKKNDMERTDYSSVKEFDEALNDEIGEALRSAERDLGEGMEDDMEVVAAELMGDDTDDGITTAGDDDVGSTTWDELKGQVYDAADGVKAKLSPDDATAGGGTAEYKPTPPAETPGEKAMKQYESIDVSASSSSTDNEVVSDAAAEELLEALREAEQAAADAEEMSKRAEEEAAREEALASMAEAYQAALDAANENVDLLSSQIELLEGELTVTIGKMEKSMEDKERISAEYAFLAKNYGDLKKSSNSANLIGEEIEGYKSKISALEQTLEAMEVTLKEAQEDAANWKAEYDAVQSDTSDTLVSTKEENEKLELRVLEITATMEEEKLRAQEEANASIDKLQSQFDATISESQKMVAALRQALRKTRKEKSYLEMTSSEERTKAVDDVRSKMNSEVANLKNVLKSLEGEMGEKDMVMQQAKEGADEMNRLMEENRYVCGGRVCSFPMLYDMITQFSLSPN